MKSKGKKKQRIQKESIVPVKAEEPIKLQVKTDVETEQNSEQSEQIQAGKTMKNKKKRKKWPWILLSIFLVLVIGITLLVKWQWNNVLALYYASVYTPEQLQQMQKDNEAVMQEICDRVSNVDFSRLPEEAQKMLQTGELTEENAIAILTGKLTWEEFIESDALAEEDAEGTEFGGTTSDSASRVDEIIAQMYVLRSGYMGKLDSLVSQAWSEYKKGGISKQDLINKYMGIGYGLEGECDGQMEALLTELQTELSETGGDTNLINDIRHTYLSQKSIKKAEIIAKYQK